ncbi:MAG: hypothetical protein QOK16_268, partial [Solirubrobacteraceae bacterium]|nr:hypothetical protein [Solirubrobacteraceae bacterium]
RIISVTIGRQGATVQVAASVNGRPPITDTITLAREGGRFKIASAGGD